MIGHFLLTCTNADKKDFDPAKYKVAQLRNVLMQHDVEYPSHAKKKDLIDLFNDHIKPQAAGKLLELENVVANDDGIQVMPKSKSTKKTEEKLIIEKTRKSARAATPEPLEEEPKPRRSPRKVSKSKDTDIDQETVKNETASTKASNDIGKIPDLSQSSSRTRERSPKRKSKKATDEETPKVRERSPRRKASNGTKKAKESIPEHVVQQVSSSDGSDDDIDFVSKKEFEKEIRSPFKVGTKAESSFSNDNVFQSPNESLEFKTKKSIPRKRTTGAQSPKKSAKRKTAFSSSPEPVEVKPKSPKKKALEISKFESSSPPLRESNKLDIFDVSQSESLTFKEEAAPVSDHTAHHEPEVPANETQPFDTPNEGNVSRFTNFSSNASTPNKDTPSKRKSLIPDFSKFKVSREFAKTLGFGSDDTPEEHTSQQDEDPELLSDEPQDISNLDDSDLLNLERQIEDAKTYILDEAEEAVKQINEIFDGDEKEKAGERGYEQDELEEEEFAKEPFNWSPILTFFKQVLSFTFFVTVVISALWYREQRILVGYCGTEINQPTFSNTENEYLLKVEEILQDLKPACLECPENAICLPNLKIECKQDYIVKESWYKLHGVLPVSDYCVKDQEKENIISEVLSKTLELLRTRNANIKCGDGDDLEVGISDEELYEFFFHSKKVSMFLLLSCYLGVTNNIIQSTISDEEFDEIWLKVLQDLEREPEITVRQVFYNVERKFHTNNIHSYDTSMTIQDLPRTTFPPMKMKRRQIFQNKRSFSDRIHQLN